MLRVEFRWSGDRYAHSMGIVVENHFEPVLESVEGTSDEPWPMSPVFQEVSMMESTALLVGMAGTSHFSASVEPTSNSIRFDVACRLKDPPTRLGSKYVLRRPAMVDADRSEAESNCRGGQLRLPVCPSASVGNIPSGGIVLSCQDLPDVYPQTVRWEYWLAFDGTDLVVRADEWEVETN